MTAASMPRLGTLAVVVAIFTMSLVSQASADVEMVAPGGNLQYVPPSHGGGGVTPDATPQSGKFVCSAAWATIGNVPSGYAIGNCANGQSLYRTWQSDPVNGTYYQGGYVNDPNYASCGWIADKDIGYSAPWSTSFCTGSASHAESEFINGSYAIGCGNPPACTDGTLINNSHNACDEYANYRPFSTAPHETTYLRTAPVNSNRLLYRYTAAYPSTDGSGLWEMVRDTAYKPGDGNWVWVNQSCFS
jgi:hypothetical protein